MHDAPGWVRRATWALIALHGLLLAPMIPDYFPNIDHAYHAALARQYAEHGTYPWDSINCGPEGRPNLQGPLLHYAIGGLGLLLGGTGDAYVRALAVWAVLRWAAAVWTAFKTEAKATSLVGADGVFVFPAVRPGLSSRTWS